MQKTLLSFAFTLILSALNAQRFNISIEIQEMTKSPVVGATLKLISWEDSTQVSFATTDSLGKASLSVQSNQRYRLQVRYIGMKSLEKGIKTGEASKKFVFQMEEDATALGAVTIKARKPLMRQEEDKTIVDPEPIANSSTNAYEILEKTPGLFVDQDGNIYISSATPATIYINGREQKMSASDVATMLKSLPPNSIERLEILRTPSAKYDASGSGGIVNVVLKKGVRIGLTGSANAGMNQGRYGNQNLGFTLNNSEGDYSAYLNVNVSRRDGYELLNTTRNLTSSNLIQSAYTRQQGQSAYLGYGFGYVPGKHWDLSLDGRMNYNHGQPQTNTQNQRIGILDGTVESDNFNELHNNSNTLSLNQGFNAKYKIDSIGSEVVADVNYNFFKNSTAQDFSLRSRIPENASLLGGLGDIDNQRHFFTASLDFKYKFPHNISLESGLKSSIQRFENQTDYEAIVDGVRAPDPFRTNSFNFDENIHAAYLQASKGFYGFILKAGARLEHTDMFGRQIIPADTSFRIKRNDLFPYVYFSRRLMKIAGYEMRGYLVYRRSIRRPVYEYLNPFPRFLDQYLYEAGNPALKPQFTENYEFNISFEDMPIFAIGRNNTQDIFTNVIYENPLLPEVAYRTYDNLGKNQESYFKLTGALPPGGKYFFVAGTQYTFNAYNGLYENKPLDFRRGSWSFFTYHQLKLDEFSMIMLNGFLRLKGQQQFYELSDFGGLSLSINRQFWKRKITVTLNVSDILYTNTNQFSIAQGNITANGDRRGDTRRIGLNIRYNFGLRKPKEENNGGGLNFDEGR